MRPFDQREFLEPTNLMVTKRQEEPSISHLAGLNPNLYFLYSLDRWTITLEFLKWIYQNWTLTTHM
jgi:hypothetical protein